MLAIISLAGVILGYIVLYQTGIDPPGECECTKGKDGKPLHELRAERPRWRS